MGSRGTWRRGFHSFFIWDSAACFIESNTTPSHTSPKPSPREAPDNPSLRLPCPHLGSRLGVGSVQYKAEDSHDTIPYHTMPCHAMPCHAMPCHAMPCHAMPCHAMPCHTIPSDITPCYTVLYRTMSRGSTRRPECSLEFERQLVVFILHALPLQCITFDCQNLRCKRPLAYDNIPSGYYSAQRQ